VNTNDHKGLLAKISKCIENYDINEIAPLVKSAIHVKIPVSEIIESMGKGMKLVGDKYAKGDFFLPDLIMAGETMKAALTILKPHLDRQSKNYEAGKVIIGTVKGDIHDIGKNILASLLSGAGFMVYDLGVDVSAEVFVDQVRKYKPDIVAMSALLTTTMPEMRKVISSLDKSKLRGKVKIIVGGASVSESFAKEIGADAYSKDAFKGVEICKKMIRK
jgi:5-methyltetrahydrofolate--homocysteine methyltransferase